MIRKILKLKNVGLLQDATQAGAVSLAQVTALFADNGRGKSTLGAVLRSCQLGDAGRLDARKTVDATSNPEVELLLPTGSCVQFTQVGWSSTLPDIVIFDAEFVEQNVYSGFEVRPDQRQALLEFALGDPAVRLKRQIDQLAEEIAAQTRKRSQAEETTAAFASPYTVGEFIALRPVPNAQQQIDALQKRIGATRNAQALTARKDPATLAPLQFDGPSVFGVLKTQIEDLDEAAEAAVKAHFVKHPSEGFEDWVSRGQQYLGGVDCPFCGQAVAGLRLVEAYRSYFSRAYADLKREVARLEAQVATGLADSIIKAAVSVAATNAARVEAWKDQLDLSPPTLDEAALCACLGRVRAHLLGLVAAKQRAPLQAVGLQSDADSVAAGIAEINRMIASYNAAIQAAAARITEYKSALGAENTAALRAEIEMLEATQKRMLPKVTSAVADYQAAETERQRLHGEKTRARGQLDALMEATLRQYQASINGLLDAFAAEFAIEQLRPTYQGGGEPRSEYCLCLRNTAVRLGGRGDLAAGRSFATTLSEGDKRTLAFAFFFARLQAEANLGDKLVVLDDPVSSFDRNRRRESLRLIVDLAGRCRQLLVMSHDAYFVRELKERLGEREPTPIIPSIFALKRVKSGYSAFAKCDIEDACSSDYYRHHRLVADYVDGTSMVGIRDVAKAIRPLLEGYYHRRFPRRIPRGLMFGQIIAMAARASPGDPLAYLQPLLEEMGKVNDYASQFHHDTNPSFETVAVADPELLAYAKRALKLIYQNG